MYMINAKSSRKLHKHFHVFQNLKVNFLSDEEDAPYYDIAMRDLKINKFSFDPEKSGILMSEATQSVNINNVGVFFECEFYMDVNLTGMVLNMNQTESVVPLKYTVKIQDLKYSTEV